MMFLVLLIPFSGLLVNIRGYDFQKNGITVNHYKRVTRRFKIHVLIYIH